MDAQRGEMHYGTEFFASQAPTSQQSARVLVPYIMQILDPASVVDVGCGTGAWLSVFGNAGVGDILGIDGQYVDRELLEIPEHLFLARDLALPLDIRRQFDLVVSLEVAEHLPAERGEQFIDSLVSLGSAVLFSAAIPGQGGTSHVNERWQAYWVSLFENRDYVCLDVIRPRVWDDERVDWWYRQNTFLLISAGRLEQNPTLRDLASVPGGPRSIVHPRLLQIMTARLGTGSGPPTRGSRVRRRLPDPVKKVLRAGRHLVQEHF